MTAQTTAINSISSVVNQQDTQGVGSQVVQAIRNAATKTGVDFSYLLQKATQESSLNPTAKASGSSATGLFQFTSQTWLQMVKDHGAQYGLEGYASQITADSNGHLRVADPVARHAILALRNDPQTSAEMAGELDKQNATVLQQNVGGKIGGTELYLAHFLGAGGASDFLSTLHSDPHAVAANVLPNAAAANQSVFYTKSGQPRTVAQIYQNFAHKFSGNSDVQLASAASSAKPVHSYTVASAVPNASSSLNSLLSASSAVASTGATTSSIAGYSDGGRIALSGTSTLFNTMVLGQLQDIGQGIHSPLGALNEFDHSGRKHSGSVAAVG